MAKKNRMTNVNSDTDTTPDTPETLAQAQAREQAEADTAALLDSAGVQAGGSSNASNPSTLTTSTTESTKMRWTGAQIDLAVDTVLELASADATPTKNELHAFLVGHPLFASVVDKLSPASVGIKWGQMVKASAVQAEKFPGSVVLPRLAHLPKTRQEQIGGWLSKLRA